MNMLRFLALVPLLFAAAAAPAQEREGRVYAPGAFDRIDLGGAAQVTLTQGPRDQVFVAGGDEVQQGVEVKVVDNRLVLRPGGAWKFWHKSKLQVEVQIRQLSQLALSGASDVLVPGPFKADRLQVSISGAGLVRFDALNAAALAFHVSGAGDGQLAGQVGDLNLSVSGKGKLMAEQLRATHATVSISGIGNAQLWVTDSLRVGISGVGNIDYWGRPEVTRSTSGLGSVNSLGDKR